jgi:hypothetical protein
MSSDEFNYTFKDQDDKAVQFFSSSYFIHSYPNEEDEDQNMFFINKTVNTEEDIQRNNRGSTEAFEDSTTMKCSISSLRNTYKSTSMNVDSAYNDPLTENVNNKNNTNFDFSELNTNPISEKRNTIGSSSFMKTPQREFIFSRKILESLPELIESNKEEGIYTTNNINPAQHSKNINHQTTSILKKGLSKLHKNDQRKVSYSSTQNKQNPSQNFLSNTMLNNSHIQYPTDDRSELGNRSSTETIHHLNKSKTSNMDFEETCYYFTINSCYDSEQLNKSFSNGITQSNEALYKYVNSGEYDQIKFLDNNSKPYNTPQPRSLLKYKQSDPSQQAGKIDTVRNKLKIRKKRSSNPINGLCKIIKDQKLIITGSNVEQLQEFIKTNNEPTSRYSSSQNSACSEEGAHKSNSVSITDEIFISNEPTFERKESNTSSSMNNQKSNMFQSLKDSRKSICCNCKHSNCLKYYCDCFKSGYYCNGCTCVNCLNLQKYEELRQKSYTHIKSKLGINGSDETTAVKKTKGCKCSNSKCLKKYCECYSKGNKCSDSCKCVNCSNGDHNHDDNIAVDASNILFPSKTIDMQIYR